MKTLATLATVAGLAFAVAGCSAESTSPAARPGPAWTALPKAPVRIEAGLTSVWTGKRLIVSGVRMGRGGTFIGSTDVAAAYDPATRSWRRLARPPKTAAYCRRDAVWTGREMLVWGCGQLSYDPATDTWARLPKAPTGEGIAVWTGREVIGWGGGCCGDAWDGGSAYDPATNAWRTIARTPLAPAQGALGAWTGHELLLLVSGIDPASGKPYPARFARAAAYEPGADAWHRIAPPLETGSRLGGAAVWDGRDLIVLGAGSNARKVLAYRPAQNRWRPLAQLPFPLRNAEAFWTGKRLLVWGGAESARALSYNPSTNRWTAFPHAPLHGSGQAAVWTGHRLLLWSGDGGAALDPSERSTR
jgi:hypothetical protein